MVGGVETDGGDEDNNISYHHIGVNDHLAHPGKGQQNHQIYHPEVEADDKGSSHSGFDGLEGRDTDSGWDNQCQGYFSPVIDLTLSPG